MAEVATKLLGSSIEQAQPLKGVLLTIAALLCLVGVGGCSANKSLAHRLQGANRIIVTNTYEHLFITITGEEVHKIVKAIVSAKKVSPLITSTPGLRLEFFEDGERLETVNTSYLVFWIDNKPYEDTTPALKELYQKFHDEHLPKFSQ